MLLLKPVKPTDFFKNGKPVDMLALQPDVTNVDDTTMPYIYLNNAMLLAKYFDKRQNMKRQPGAYFHIGYPAMYFFYNFLEIMFPRFTGFYTVHGPSPLKKSTYETLWNLEGEYLDQVCSHPFRHREDVSQYVIREYQKLSGNFIPKKAGSPGVKSKLPFGTQPFRFVWWRKTKDCLCIGGGSLAGHHHFG